MAIGFVLPEHALPGSVKITFHGLAAGTILTLSGLHESAGMHSFHLDTGTPVDGTNVVAGAKIPDGLYSVTLSYRDARQNPPASNTAAGVLLVRLLLPLFCHSRPLQSLPMIRQARL
jgi:hypothetical protein